MKDPVPPRRDPLRRTSPMTLRWIGMGGSPTVERVQSVTVDPDTGVPSEAMPEWLIPNGLGGYAAGTAGARAAIREKLR